MAFQDLTVTNKDAIEQLNEEGPVFEISLTARSSSGEDDGDAEDVAQWEKELFCRLLYSP